MDELVGAAEIAERLDLSHTENVHTWRRRHADFPEPVAQLKQALIWYWPDVEAWAKKTGRLPQPPAEHATATPSPKPRGKNV